MPGLLADDAHSGGGTAGAGAGAGACDDGSSNPQSCALADPAVPTVRHARALSAASVGAGAGGLVALATPPASPGGDTDVPGDDAAAAANHVTVTPGPAAGGERVPLMACDPLPHDVLLDCIKKYGPEIHFHPNEK